MVNLYFFIKAIFYSPCRYFKFTARYLICTKNAFEQRNKNLLPYL